MRKQLPQPQSDANQREDSVRGAAEGEDDEFMLGTVGNVGGSV
jgi:hypothetical protein